MEALIAWFHFDPGRRWFYRTYGSDYPSDYPLLILSYHDNTSVANFFDFWICTTLKFSSAVFLHNKSTIEHISHMQNQIL